MGGKASGICFENAWVAELVDARDLKSLGACPCTSSILVPGTIKIKGLRLDGCNPFPFCGYCLCNSCVIVSKNKGYVPDFEMLLGAERVIVKIANGNIEILRMFHEFQLIAAVVTSAPGIALKNKIHFFSSWANPGRAGLQVYQTAFEWVDSECDRIPRALHPRLFKAKLRVGTQCLYTLHGSYRWRGRYRSCLVPGRYCRGPLPAVRHHLAR
jgi:hypothetical protein